MEEEIKSEEIDQELEEEIKSEEIDQELKEEIKSEEIDQELKEEIKSEEIEEEINEEIINNKGKHSNGSLKKIINNISCQNYLTAQNKTFCWDGNKFFPFENQS